MISVFDQGPPAPCPAPFNMAAHVLGQAPMQPEKTALSVIGANEARDWSYGEIEAAVRGIGTGLSLWD